MDEGSSSEEEPIPIPQKKKALKSGKLRTVDSLVLHHVTLPHNGVYHNGETGSVRRHFYSLLCQLVHVSH